MELLNAAHTRSDGGSEDALVQRASAGDADAFAVLYQKYHGPLFRYFHYRLSHKEDAEDLAGQLFLKAWQAIGSYDCRGIPFSAWLFRIAHNLLVDAKRNHWDTVELDDALEVRDRMATPEELALARMDAQELESAFRQLSPIEQSVVALRFVDGLDHRAVSGTINKSEVATRSIQSRALARLARYLKGREGGTVLARVTAAVAAILVVFGVTAVAASEALPTSPLYSTKLALEDVRLAVARGEGERLQLRLEMSGRRVSELSTVADTATASDLDRVAGLYRETVRSAVRKATGAGENGSNVIGVEAALVQEEAELRVTLGRLTDADPAKRAAVQQALGVVEQERIRLRQSEGAGSLDAPGSSSGAEQSGHTRQRQAPSFETPPSPAPPTQEPGPTLPSHPAPAPSPQMQLDDGGHGSGQGIVLDATPVPAPPVPGAGELSVDTGSQPPAEAGFGATQETPSGDSQGSWGQVTADTPTAAPASVSATPSDSAPGAGSSFQQGMDATPGPSDMRGSALAETPTAAAATSSPSGEGPATPSPLLSAATSTPAPPPASPAASYPNGGNGTGGPQGGSRSGGSR